jgi:hypothetical protein
MFTRNSDLLCANFSPDYFWKILLEECSLRRITITCHCAVDKATEEFFHQQAALLEAAWAKGRERAVGMDKKGALPIPMYFSPPISWLCQGPTRPSRLVSLDLIENPIEKAMLLLRYSESPGEYCIKIRTTNAMLKKIRKDDAFDSSLFGNYELEKQYYAGPIIISTTPGVEIKSEWVNDLYELSPSDLTRKYWASAKANMIKLISTLPSKAGR